MILFNFSLANKIIRFKFLLGLVVNYWHFMNSYHYTLYNFVFNLEHFEFIFANLVNNYLLGICIILRIIFTNNIYYQMLLNLHNQHFTIYCLFAFTEQAVLHNIRLCAYCELGASSCHFVRAPPYILRVVLFFIPVAPKLTSWGLIFQLWSLLHRP